ncbi:bifunctional methylenetetrahydrofolate dehydrogenase/methenyltetrahydrofolate cyclohydrolase FolD [Noviherbaspirillum saxi]|uniref:Bifunctional protein FolD n=1 Tax=Noviherbaspirillum saxi TaxID=2320863 RepID=A0A3A3FYW5_9BURK|nr:bifunctional methylenetetrahydrofolate dehydrogenase/methenyltetrahydrofolate cyclohydrolase FolD [Noviherbaspirillum saxi]RJF92289.1 bifunctional methylenetetrahydrofolate dehydrogenase/methenyltetrahydrofolate cyclohydrolase FolD [Noviherbaspirillum saxi]
MSAAMIDGKAHAAALRAQVAAAGARFREELGRPAGLAVVLVGDDAASGVYVASKARATLEAGMESFTHRLPASATQAEVLELLASLNQNEAVDGILVQLPLPAQIDETAVIDAIHPDKDVDGFHVLNAGRLAIGQNGLVPCTPLGCLMLLRACRGSLAGLRAVVVGRSNIVGKPMARLLLAQDCTVTVAHSRTRDLQSVVHDADILVVAIGRPLSIPGAWIKPGATVIDVGINRIDDPTGSGKSRLVGDVDFDSAALVAGAITPVPGGVGPMTIAVLLRNTVVAARRRAGLSPDAMLSV